MTTTRTFIINLEGPLHQNLAGPMAEKVMAQGVTAGSGEQVFSSTDTLSEFALAVTRSGLPSLSKSPTATDTPVAPGLSPKLEAGPKPPVPSPSRTDPSPEILFAVARSGFPSLLKSPTATENGRVPTA